MKKKYEEKYEKYNSDMDNDNEEANVGCATQ